MRARGFTLVEMVVAITISAVLMGTIALIISRPVEAYAEQSRRNELIDTSDRIGRMLGNDLAKALPNSVRIQDFGNTKVLQMLEVTDVLYYQEESPAPASIGLNFAGDTGFQAYGTLTSETTLLVIGDTAGAAYGNVDVITSVAIPTGAPRGFGAHDISFASFKFASSSSTNRAFAIKDAPITYVCNLISGRLTRFADHARDTSIPADEGAVQLNSVGASSSVVATGVTACALQCAAMIGNRCQQTLTFSATVERGVLPDVDRIRVTRSYRVENTT